MTPSHLFSPVKTACDATAIIVAWLSSMTLIGWLTLIQGIFGALGTVLSVVYLAYRIRNIRRAQ